MMSGFMNYFAVLLCYSVSNLQADSIRYYYDYECNEPLVESSKLTATSSLRERGPDNAKLYDWTLKLNETGKMSPKVNIRWAFNASKWIPTEDQILALSCYIQPEEKQRISRFVFQDDAKSSLIGRVMMRKFVHISTSIPYNEVKLGRDGRGKPYLLGVGDIPVSFNVSHQGDYVVLAGSTARKVGIDVMKIEPPANKNIPEFFRLMKRQFSNHEWTTIYGYDTESQQIACFYRMWCLKESYVKNIGLGITVPLDEISFAVTSALAVGKLTTDTKLYERGVLKHDWVFEETLLDATHAVAVSTQIKDNDNLKPESFQFLQFEDLVNEAQPLNQSDSVFTNNFMKKEMKTF